MIRPLARHTPFWICAVGRLLCAIVVSNISYVQLGDLRRVAVLHIIIEKTTELLSRLDSRPADN